MTCPPGTACHHSPTCQDKHCPGRGMPADELIEDGLLYGGALALTLVITLIVVCGAAGWVWATYGLDIKHLFWTAAALIY